MKKEYKVFVHDTVASPVGQRGVNRCFLEYSRALGEAFPGQVLVITGRQTSVKGARVEQPLPSWGQRLGLRNRLAPYAARLAALQADLLANIYYSPFYGHARTHIPQVFSAYDMIYEKFPQYFPLSEGNGVYIQEKRLCLERAHLIVSISHNTAQDLLELYPHIDPQRVLVVHLGVDDLFFTTHADVARQTPYFLFVGNRERYKNFSRLLKAYGKSGLSRVLDLRLVLPLPVPFRPDELDLIEKYRLTEHIHVEADVPDGVLSRRYSGAFAFVCPSEYEGFGLPLLEAMASGTVVLSSTASSLPEVGGDVPLYFDPLSEDSIMDALVSASDLSERQRTERVQRGKARASQFTWQASRTAFANAIRALL